MVIAHAIHSQNTDPSCGCVVADVHIKGVASFLLCDLANFGNNPRNNHSIAVQQKAVTIETLFLLLKFLLDNDDPEKIFSGRWKNYQVAC
jgi:hypothetical protein